VLIAETIGLWFLNNHLVISPERMYAANWVYQCAIISFCFTILNVPYIANIITQEKMSSLMYISVIDLTLKLLSVMILKFSEFDNLILYSILMTLTAFSVWMLYLFYNMVNFKITRYKFYWDKKLFLGLLGYTGWNLFGSVAVVVANQGVNIIINLFFGPTINASRAIAQQVNNAISGIVMNLNMSISPQMVKSYAEGNIDYMRNLIFISSKFSFFLMYFISVPLILNMKDILVLWLGVLPNYVISFCDLIIIDALIISISNPLMSAFQATGKIVKYQVFVGTVLLLNLPITYVFFKQDYAPSVTFFVSISLSLLALFLRWYLLLELIPKVMQGFDRVLVKIFNVIVFSIIPIGILRLFFLNDYLYQKIFLTIFSNFWVLTVIWFIGLTIDERKYLKNLILNKLGKIK
jgi:O-antigen/teichoic acid export membrane protein